MSWNTSRFIIGALEHSGPCTVAELAQKGRLSQAAIRNHMSGLVAAGSVVRQGIRAPYRYALTRGADRG
jgi:predicted ArsR family transcriptional regulator